MERVRFVMQDYLTLKTDAMPTNNDPFKPWNDPMKDSPFAPHNGLDADNPFKPWNDPVGDTSRLTDEEKRYYGIR